MIAKMTKTAKNKKFISIHISENLIESLKHLATENKRSMNSLLNYILETYVEAIQESSTAADLQIDSESEPESGPNQSSETLQPHAAAALEISNPLII